MSINILYIIDKFGYGGTELQLAALINGLDKNQFKVHLCTFKPSSKLFDDLKCEKYQLSIPRLWYPNAFSQYRILLKLIRGWNIHIIHTFFQDPFAVGTLMKKFYPTVLVGSFRDMGFWRTRMENFKMRISYTAFDAFIANSKAVKQHFEMTDRLKPERIRVIYNGYNGLPRSSTSAPRRDGSFTVGIVANFNRPVKRFEDFLKIAQILWSRDPSTRFIVVGSVGGRYNELVNQAQNKMGPALNFVGSVSNPVDYIREFDIGVITSESEGFCNAIIEYMACGLPVVVTDTGGNKEIVDQGINGFLVPVADPKAMAEKIGVLQADSELRIRMGRANMHKVETRYSMARMIGEHEKFYTELITGNF